MSQVSREEPIIKLLLGSLALFSGLFLGAGGLLVGTILTLGVVAVLVVGAGIEVTPVMLVVIALLFTQGIGCMGVALSYYKLRPHIAPPIRSLLGLPSDGPPFDIPAAVPDVRDVTVIIVGYVTAIGGVVVALVTVTAVQNYTGTEIDSGTNTIAETGLQNPELLLLLIPISILLIGPGEELLFRGVVQGRIREFFSPVPGIVIPSLMFAGIHWFALSGGSPQGNLVSVGILFIPAMVLGVAYEYTGNIVVPSLIHGFYNATLFSLAYIVITFGGQMPQ